MRIFGSSVRGDSGVYSDVDFLIELEPGRSFLDIVAIKQDLEELLKWYCGAGRHNGDRCRKAERGDRFH